MVSKYIQYEEERIERTIEDREIWNLKWKQGVWNNSMTETNEKRRDGKYKHWLKKEDDRGETKR